MLCILEILAGNCMKVSVMLGWQQVRCQVFSMVLPNLTLPAITQISSSHTVTSEWIQTQQLWTNIISQRWLKARLNAKGVGLLDLGWLAAHQVMIWHKVSICSRMDSFSTGTLFRILQICRIEGQVKRMRIGSYELIVFATNNDIVIKLKIYNLFS